MQKGCLGDLRSEQSGGLSRHRLTQMNTHFSQRAIDGGGVRHVRRTRLGGQALIGLRQVRSQIMDDLNAGGHDLPTQRRQLSIPHIEGGQGRFFLL